ncbi:hypothetical protein RHMOL_Rhmol01G0188200 [Rhododendron molle]|uniref:Uncharacterized protein n=1 Tax=Rhododendron molle TaxID=49168 RepID=A0ACC0Q2W0_RHOML|nr:hypothetical protein RHMOL_Rhmol01G0188200 [Rhododendron molle]
MCYHGSVKDRLGFTPENGNAREQILYKQQTTSAMHRSRSHQERSRSKVTTGLFTSTYSIDRAEFSCTTASHHSRGSFGTRRHISERLGEIPLENLKNEMRAKQDGKGIRIEEQDDDRKVHHGREKSIDGPHRVEIDLRDKLPSPRPRETFS